MTTKRLAIFSLSILVVFGMALGMVTYVLAVHDLGLFELDRNAFDDPLIAGDDWSTLYSGGGNAKAFTGVLQDIGANGGTQFTGGGSKDISDITDWLWKPGEPLDKDDITDAYAAAYVYKGLEVCPPGANPGDPNCTEPGDLILYYGLDRFAVNGSAQVGFWFLQDPTFGLTNTSSQGGFLFSGVHMDNDVLVQSNFSNGGVISRITVYKWLSGALVKIVDVADCSTSAAGDLACATVNQAPQTSPWPYTPKSGTADIFPISAFFEGGINISNLIPEVGCFTGFIAETRSSTPFTAQLKDFVTGNFSLCSMKVTKTGDTLSKVGDPVDYSVTIENTGALTLYKDNITDTLLGNITLNGVDQTNPYVTNNTCGASLAIGASCTITLQRIVQAGDPDPLPNTVTATYRGKSDLSGIAITKTDDHSVNLFQPSIDLTKTGDTLSKITDKVDYVITLHNTSSADTPDLTCTVTDPTVSVNETFSVASGADHVINVKDFVIPPNAADPFVNTASVSCSPAGFPNVLTDSAEWSTNLFQPSIELTKIGPTLSKIGDKVDYVITLHNTSSTDTPDLTCTVTDATVGVNETFSVASGADHVINVNDFVIPANAADPFPNSASVSCSPAGFPNILLDSDQWSINLFQPSIDLTKTGDTLSKIGDKVDYVITLHNTSSADTPDLTCTVTDPTVSVNSTFSVASGADHPINVTDFVIPNGASDPFVNTASVTCSPAGFTNVLTDSAQWSTNLFQPVIDLTKTGDALSKKGDTVDYVITLHNTSSADTPTLTCTVTDATVGVNSTFTVASGADHPINVNNFVIPNTASDPFVNTASVSCSPAGFPNVLTDSAQWSTNLFQPSIDLTKTGDTLSKIGDKVDYVITLHNTSSADTPNLTCTVTDATVGVNSTFSVASGIDHPINVTDFVIPANAADPFINTASVSCSPAGFPNVLTDSAQWSTNLFQPSIDLTKTGDTLSKRGDTVDYVITLHDTSSADTPNLNCTLIDATVGVSESFSVASSADHVINVNDFVIPANAADPFVNNASVSCSPAGFTNVLTDSAQWSTNLFQPAIDLTKTGDSLSKIGDKVDYVITLFNNSSADTPDLTCTVTDATVGVDSTFTLAHGTDHSINVTDFVIPNGASDPFVNTASVTCSPAGFTNVLTDSAQWSTNLFQPAINVNKTGDALGKIGDPVEYTVTLSNNSSSDTPAITCTASDTLHGSLFSGVLPLGDTVINYSRTVLANDPDPLVNTAGMTCSIAGFPNVLSDSDSHTTQLFQPAVQVVKSGPASAGSGETITYGFTITNQSSLDSPNLILDSVTDTVIGDITAAAAPNCSTLAPGASCSFSVNYTIKATDPNPLVNVVTVLYHPAGFTNKVTDDDSHSLTIPNQGCTPGFWQGGAGAPLWDQVNDPQWIYNGTNPFIHTTDFNTFFNTVTDPRLVGLSMFDLVSGGGGSDWAVKAARDMVAAYLNESAFPNGYPAASLAALTTMWYNAVTGGDSALEAFHNLVSGWNSPASPGYCPLP